jgi:hypothetical protein
MRSLSIDEIGIFASHRGVDKRDVEDFLDTVGHVNGGVKLSNYGGIKLTTNLKSFLQA